MYTFLTDQRTFQKSRICKDLWTFRSYGSTKGIQGSDQRYSGTNLIIISFLRNFVIEIHFLLTKKLNKNQASFTNITRKEAQTLLYIFSLQLLTYHNVTFPWSAFPTLSSYSSVALEESCGSLHQIVQETHLYRLLLMPDRSVGKACLVQLLALFLGNNARLILLILR